MTAVPSFAHRASQDTGDPDAPLVSVAIIAFNQEDYIGSCLQSVIDQDYRPLEIIVADDCSTDRTRQVLTAFRDRHPDLIRLVLAEENRGITGNSTVAHRACHGKYIAWLGGDDLMCPGKLSAQVELMEANPSVNICYHDLDVFDSDTGLSLRRFSGLNKPRQGDVRALIRYGTFNGGSSNMVRRTCAPDGFDSRIPVTSDWLYWIQTLTDGGQIAFIPKVLGRYRRHDDNVTDQDLEKSRRLLVENLMTCSIVFASSPRFADDVLFAAARVAVAIGRRMSGGRIIYYMVGAASLVLSVVLWLPCEVLRKGHE